jgi:hypothetical protein
MPAVLGGRELQYVIEFDELESAIWETLNRIRERDGVKIFEEVAETLIEGIASDLKIAQGKRGDLLRSMIIGQPAG